ncbi:PUM-HD domain-containing protein [Mycena indigotica]|uniref:PUM-HD domain-containing protein n=1 Tax=Mycena indigotica TaxID=2126181 RepID=A0A8H6SA32_9AGAR|nr:PUM-HD domain-containing protein [Mycena indigotica]KAF7294896.1 PUM-HD domain-containing protein [Mycena indigotica]
MLARAGQPPRSATASGTWDDSVLKSNITRPRHAGKFSAPRMDDRASGGRPTTFQNNQPSFPMPSLGYETAENDITLAMRGMTVEDDFSGRQPVVPVPPQVSTSRTSPLPQQPRYGGYDYGYYSPGREAFPEYAYYASPDLNAYRPPMSPYTAVAPAPSSDPRQPVFFDYNSPPPFYYPTSPMLYQPPSPMLPSQLPSTPVTMTEKKIEMQHNLQQQLASRNMMFPPLSPMGYPPQLDYGNQMLNMYGGGPGFGMMARGNRRFETQTLSSKMLDEFRAAKGKKWELKDLKGHIVEFSSDQHGSRFIQTELNDATSEEIQSVFDEIVPDNTLHLIQDVFGNYVIQKLLEHGTQAHKDALVGAMEGHIIYLSSNVYGCRVVQKAFECVTPEQQAKFVQELEPHILRCVKDSNGNHVIQKVIERVSPDRLGFISTFIGHAHELASHPFGCRVLQQCLRHLPEPYTRPLLDELLKSHTANLMQDQFGNYVVQFILENGLPRDRASIITQLRGRMLSMARHKFASNVCEKAMIFGDSDGRKAMIEELMGPALRPDGPTPIGLLMKDQYGNYVLQRALSVAEGEQKEALINAIRPQLATMRKHATAYSKHLTSIERELQKHTPKPDCA